MKRGKLIVIEGPDGSGKTTQQQLLQAYLAQRGTAVRSVKFPNYEGSFFGKTLAAYLRGDLGPLTQMNPYFVSLAYAMDRASSRDQMNTWLDSGDMLVLDRYVSSNLAHQCGRLPKKERNKYFAWDMELEYEVNKLPQEDIVIYLYIPYKITKKLLMNAGRDRGYARGKKRDIVEKDETYLKNAEDTYLWLAKKCKHWVKITCVDTKGNLKSREAIHEEIKKVLEKKKLI